MYIKSNDLFKDYKPELVYETTTRPVIIADHLLTPDNIGAMIRLSDNIGASEMIFLGKEPTHSIGRIRRCAASSKDNIKWYFTEDNDIRRLVGEGKSIVAIETATNATNIYKTELPRNAAFIVGNEAHGIREEILKQCDFIIYIPIPGPTRSLNVSHAASVALFEWYRQVSSTGNI
ncbi:MAG: TrmH family RNA methyltransferase [Candidatus Limimorpha sp.]